MPPKPRGTLAAPAAASATGAPKPEDFAPKRDGAPPKRDGAPPLDDLLLRLLGVPAFGLAIPHVLGLFGPRTPREPVYWAGHAWFLALSWLIWHGNRWLLFRQRGRAEWSGRPLRKILRLLLGVVFGTIPVTVAMLAAWYRLAALPMDWPAIELCTLTNVICVVFVTHVYETVFLIKAREEDLLRVERLSRARAEAALSALRAQVDPHFLFNCLNALGYLIEHEPARAAEFNRRLAAVYRYLLGSHDRPLVFLGEELAFVEDYAALLRLRFGEALQLTRAGAAPLDRRLLPPVSIQTLLENVVKHNALDRERPLRVRLTLLDDAVELWSERRPRPAEEARSGVGLANLAERFRLATARTVEIAEDGDSFAVRLPLLRA